MEFLQRLLTGRSRRQEAIDEYNLGLKAKYAGEWQKSLTHNQRAAELNPKDGAAWWNLAIAATALHDWPEARRAWLALGVTPDQEQGEVSTPETWACVRLAPDDVGEVVWGRRIDPARTVLMNVPLPESDRLYGDIILNDGAPEGIRQSGGTEYPVFNELTVWKRSKYSTFEVHIDGAGDLALSGLGRLCEEQELHFEDWGTVRNLCAACSRGNPGEHECTTADDQMGASRFGFAAASQDALEKLLSCWSEIAPEVSWGAISLVVCGAMN